MSIISVDVMTGQTTTREMTAEEAAAILAPPVLTANDIRTERDHLLAASDWTQVADAPVDQAAWAAYRQELRDVPDQVGFPETVIWPIKPE